MAKAFTFRYEALMRHRSRDVDEITQEMGKRQKAVLDEEERLDRVRRTEREYALKLRDAQRRVISPAAVQDYHVYMAHLRETVGVISQSLIQLRKALNEKRRELVLARQKERAVEILKENAVQEHRTAVEKEEVTTLDEISLGRFMRERLAKTREKNS